MILNETAMTDLKNKTRNSQLISNRIEDDRRSESFFEEDKIRSIKIEDGMKLELPKRSDSGFTPSISIDLIFIFFKKIQIFNHLEFVC